MLSIARDAYLDMVAEAWRVYPLEACGLMAGRPGSDMVERFHPIHNAAESSRVFTLDSMGYMKAERAADDAGHEIVGVFHSHTHTQAYPSPTDVAEATKPLVPTAWRWVIVSLEHGLPELRSFLVSAGSESEDSEISEEPVGLLD